MVWRVNLCKPWCVWLCLCAIVLQLYASLVVLQIQGESLLLSSIEGQRRGGRRGEGKRGQQGKGKKGRRQETDGGEVEEDVEDRSGEQKGQRGEDIGGERRREWWRGGANIGEARWEAVILAEGYHCLRLLPVI